MTKLSGTRPRLAATAAVLAAGCHQPDPPPEDPQPVVAKAIACPAEVRFWLAMHACGPDDAVADLCDRLDKFDDAALRSFDRQSPSHIGYRDVRADLRDLVAAHPRVTVRDLGAFKTECVGRWQAADPPAGIR